MVESWLFSSLMLVEAHNWHQWNDESIEQEGWAVDIHFSFRLEYLSSYLKRPCCFFREQLTWLMSLCWVREGCTSHWGIKNDQDHHQNLYNLPRIKGKHERSWISWHALGGTEISVSFKKRFEEVSSEMKKKLLLGKRTYYPVLCRMAVHYPTEHSISQRVQTSNLIQRSQVPINL